MKLSLPDLPYALDALDPIISARTLEFHHGKHHAGYVDKTKAAVAGTPLADASVEDILHQAHSTGDQGLYNNAAQTWNHAFYWRCLGSDTPEAPDGDLAKAIVATFGSVGDFRDTFCAAAAGAFGSGWAWLVLDAADGSLQVVTTHDADTPLVHGQIPLLTLDLWEHAYYLDYQNARPKYIEACFDQLVDWDFVASNWRNGAGKSAKDVRLAA